MALERGQSPSTTAQCIGVSVLKVQGLVEGLQRVCVSATEMIRPPQIAQKLRIVRHSTAQRFPVRNGLFVTMCGPCVASSGDRPLDIIDDPLGQWSSPDRSCNYLA